MKGKIENILDTTLQRVRRYSEGFKRNAKERDIEVASEHLTDLLTDLRHACRLAGIDFDRSVRLSEMHHNSES